MGIKGFVTTPDGSPLPDSIISVDYISHPIKTAQYGDYWRLLVPGNYVIKVSRPGYETQSKQVTVVGNHVTWLNFTLSTLKTTHVSTTTIPITEHPHNSNPNLDTLVSQINQLADFTKRDSVLNGTIEPNDSMFVHHDQQKMIDVLNKVKEKCSLIASLLNIGYLFKKFR